MKARTALGALLAALLAGCSSIHIGIGLPIPGIGSVGVGVGSDGRVSGGVTVGTGAVSVGVGGSTQLPRSAEAPASAASGAAAKP
jgi:hypothetical protein